MASGRVYQAIRDYIDGKSPTPAAWSATPVAWENEDKDRAGSAIPPSPAVTFIDLELTGTLYDAQSLGAGTVADNRWDEEGLLFINVNVPKGEGAQEGRDIAKKFLDLFRGKLLASDHLEFYEGSIGQGRESRIAGNWWLIPAWIKWRFVDAPIDT